MDDQIERLEIEKSQDQRFSPIVRFALIYGGILVPLLAFPLGIGLMPEWQSKTLSSYARMLLTPVTTWPFWPIIIYSMGSLAAVLSNQESLREFRVRFGLYLGGLWSFQYVILIIIGLPGADNFFMHGKELNYNDSLLVLGFGMLVTLLPLFLLFCLKGVSKKTGGIINFFINFVMVVLLLASVLSASFYLTHAILSEIFYVEIPMDFVFAQLVPAPFWCFAVYLYLSVYAYRANRGEKLIVVLNSRVARGWIGGYLAAWVSSLISMRIAYSQLYENYYRSDCYVATAAARGHRSFVGAVDVELDNGEVMRVNDQLKCLKCGELMLKASCPKLHWLFRVIYNVIGPVLARCLVSPILADIAYIILKPMEWLTGAVIFVIFGKKLCAIRQQYYKGKQNG